MLLQSEIAHAYEAQQVNLQSEMGTSRTQIVEYTENSTHIEVISGIRRCGKSTLMRQIMARYEAQNASIAYFNFEDVRIFGFEVSDFAKLDAIMHQDGKQYAAYFFDEIQNVPSWELFIRQLHDRVHDRVNDARSKIYVTGSNASLLSKELGTRLTGRHLRHELFPFSYTEFLAHTSQNIGATSFQDYLEKGGFPEYLKSNSIEVLQMLVRDIVLRDVAVRYGIRSTEALMNITLFLLSNVGKEHTFNRLRNAFGIGSANTVSDFLSWLEDAYLLFFLPRFSWSAKNIAVNPRKAYGIDTGLIRANSKSFSEDFGRLLENAVYLYLRQSYESLYYFREEGECDFVVFEQNQCKWLIQVCLELHADNKMREIKGLMEAMAFFKQDVGYILTLNQRDTLKKGDKTIQLIPVFDFIS